MNKREVAKLDPGIYRVYWKTGGYSIAAVGVMGNGEKWLAPLNWISVAQEVNHTAWRKVKQVTLLDLSI